MILASFLLAVLAISLLGQTVPSVPSTLCYQGRLTDGVDAQLLDGEYEMTFLIFDAPTGGNLLWSEIQPGVIITAGIYRVVLGVEEPAEFSVFHSRDAYMEVRVFGEALGPRQRIVSVPFALKAEGEVPEGAVVLGESSGNTAITDLGYSQLGDTVGPYYLYRKDAYDPGSARVPGRVAYQGKVEPVGGSTVGATADFGFTIFDADTGGSVVWSETQDNVPVDASGLFSVELGVNNPVDPVELVQKDLWLSVSVNGQTLSPRERLASVGYALKVTSPTPEGAIVLSSSTTNPDLLSKKFLLVPGTTVDGYYPFRKDAFNPADPAVPLLVNYQGKLTDQAGDTLSASAVDIGFRIFDGATAGTLLWSETVGSVGLSSGIFNVLLGSSSPITPATFPGPDAWLQTTVVQGSTVETLSPRQRLTSVPFAMAAEGTLPPSALVLSTLADSDTLTSSGFQSTGDTVSGYYVYAKTDIDTTPPDLIIIEPELFGGYSVDSIAAMVSYSDSRSGIDVSTFAAYLNGETISSGFAAGETTASGTIYPSVGVNFLLVSVSDHAGNYMQAASRFYVEAAGSASPPIINIVNPANGSTINTNTPVFVIEIYDLETKIESYSVRVRGVDRTPDFILDGLTAEWQVPYEYALPDGGSTIRVEAENHLGDASNLLSSFSVALVGANPSITALDPEFGFAGDTVIITGLGFSTTLAENPVTFFNNVPAAVAQASATQLVVTVPPGAASGPVQASVNGLSSNSLTFTIGLSYGFVANYDNPDFSLGGSMVSMITFDGATPGTTRARKYFPAGSHPYDVAVSSDGRRAYVTDYGRDLVQIFDAALLGSDTAGAGLGEIPLGAGCGPKFAEISPDGLDLFVGCTTGYVYKITNDRIDIPFNFPGFSPNGIGISPYHQRLYVNASQGPATTGATGIIDIDRSNQQYLSPLIVTGTNYRHPIGLTVRPDQKEVYIANNKSNGTNDTYSFSRFDADANNFKTPFGATITSTGDYHDISHPYDLLFDPRGQLFYADFSYPVIGGTWPFVPTYNIGIQKWPGTSSNFHAGTKTEYQGSTNDYPKGMAFSPGGERLFISCFGKGNSARSRLKILDHAKVKQAIDNDPNTTYPGNQYNLTFVSGNAVEWLDSNTVMQYYPGMATYSPSAAGQTFDGPMNVAFQQFPLVSIPSVIHLAQGGVKEGWDLVSPRVHPVYGNSVMVGIDGSTVLQKIILPGTAVSCYTQWLAPNRQVFSTAAIPNGLRLNYSQDGIGKLLATSRNYPSNVAFVTVPPQEFIQVLYAEACPITGNSAYVVHRSLAAVIKNRMRLTRYCFQNPNIPGVSCLKYSYPHQKEIKANSEITEQDIVEQVAMTVGNSVQFNSVGKPIYNSAALRDGLTTNDHKGAYDSCVSAAGDATLDLLRTLTTSGGPEAGSTRLWNLAKQDAKPSDPAFNDPNYLDLTRDPTGGSFGFYSPNNSEWGSPSVPTSIAGRLADQSPTKTIFPTADNFENTICGAIRKFCVGPGQTQATYLQVVVLSKMPKNTCFAGKGNAPQFVFYRWRNADEPAVIEDP